MPPNAILGFPLIIPQLLLLIRLSKAAFGEAFREGALLQLSLLIIGFDLMVIMLAIILFLFSGRIDLPFTGGSHLLGNGFRMFITVRLEKKLEFVMTRSFPNFCMHINLLNAKTLVENIGCSIVGLYFYCRFFDPVPDIGNLKETIRNLFFHVPMWFSEIVLFTISLGYSIRYLRKPDLRFDIIASSFARTGILMGVLGLVTGSIWATYTWGEPWSNDPKQIAIAIALLIYFAYLVLRNAIPDIDKRPR
jgi:hypothetical protein